MLVQFFFLIWLQACYRRIHFAFDSDDSEEKLLLGGIWRRKSHFRAKYRSYSKFDGGFGILTKFPTQKRSCQFFVGSILSPWEGKNGSTFLSQCCQSFLLNLSANLPGGLNFGSIWLKFSGYILRAYSYQTQFVFYLYYHFEYQHA